MQRCQSKSTKPCYSEPTTAQLHQHSTIQQHLPSVWQYNPDNKLTLVTMKSQCATNTSLISNWQPKLSPTWRLVVTIHWHMHTTVSSCNVQLSLTDAHHIPSGLNNETNSHQMYNNYQPTTFHIVRMILELKLSTNSITATHYCTEVQSQLLMSCRELRTMQQM